MAIVPSGGRELGRGEGRGAPAGREGLWGRRGARGSGPPALPPVRALPVRRRGPGPPVPAAGAAGEGGAGAPRRLRLPLPLRVLPRSGWTSLLRVQSSENFAPRRVPRPARPSRECVG